MSWQSRCVVSTQLSQSVSGYKSTIVGNSSAAEAWWQSVVCPFSQKRLRDEISASEAVGTYISFGLQVVLEFDFKREAGVMDTVADNLKVRTCYLPEAFAIASHSVYTS